MPTARFSGLQKDVLTLYRECMRAAYAKPKENREHWVTFVHSQFNKYRNLPRRDFNTIEYLLRVGKKRYQMYKASDAKDVI